MAKPAHGGQNTSISQARGDSTDDASQKESQYQDIQTQKDPFGPKRLWQKSGLMMFKSALAPTIAIALSQSTSFAETYSTLGYLVAIRSITPFGIMPGAKFVQAMLFNIIGICIGSCITLLSIYRSVQARAHTTAATDWTLEDKDGVGTPPKADEQTPSVDKDHDSPQKKAFVQIDPEAKALKATVAIPGEVHGKINAGMAFAKREIAFGKLDASEISELIKLLRQIMLQIIDMSSVANIFYRIAESARHETEKAKEKVGHLHERGGGDEGITFLLSTRIDQFYEQRKATMDTWCHQKGMDTQSEHSYDPQCVDATAFGDHQRHQRRLYLVLYTTKAAQGVLKNRRLIVPGMKRIKNWVSAALSAEDSSADQTPDSSETRGINIEI
ncbi:MAG: hypothetical protein Q9166_007132 [cf. Caloplaca sp. 2 TL-2023]